MLNQGCEEFLRLLNRDNLTPTELKFLQKKAKQILRKAIGQNPSIRQSLQKIFGEDYLEDLVQEFLFRLYRFSPYLKTKETLSEAYFVKIAKNVIYYYLAKERVTLSSEGVSTFGQANPESDEGILPIDRVVSISYVEDYLREFIVESVLHTIKSCLTDKELEALCFYLMESEGRDALVISPRRRNTIYKRWERLKPKLKNILSPYLENEEDPCSYWQEIVERIRSEVCSGIDLLKDKEE